MKVKPKLGEFVGQVVEVAKVVQGVGVYLNVPKSHIMAPGVTVRPFCYANEYDVVDEE